MYLSQTIQKQITKIQNGFLLSRISDKNFQPIQLKSRTNTNKSNENLTSFNIYSSSQGVNRIVGRIKEGNLIISSNSNNNKI